MSAQRLFRGYDIRGVVGDEIDAGFAERLGEAFCALLGRKSGRVFLARDNRGHSPSLSAAFARGVQSRGLDVVDFGIAATPLMQYALAKSSAAGGCIVTASHNPPQYNGFKLYRGKTTLSSQEMSRLGKLFESPNPARARPAGAFSTDEIAADYVNDVAGRGKLSRGLKIAVDAGNGVCGPTARALFGRIGCGGLSIIFEDMESAFLNHVPDPHDHANMRWLSREVVAKKADLGVAFDGDGDRAGFVDELGRVVREDDACILFLRSLSPGRGGPAICDLRLSMAVREEAEVLGFKPVVCKAGRIAIREQLRLRKAAFGGEVSGHYFFGEHYGFDDGMFAAYKLAKWLSGQDAPLSEIVDGIRHYPATPEMRIHAERKNEVIEGVQKSLSSRFGGKLRTIDGAWLDLGDGWGLARVSNTEPAITLRFEGKTKAALRRVHSIYGKELSAFGIKIPALKRFSRGRFSSRSP